MPENNPFRDKAKDNNPFRLTDDIKAQLAAHEKELAKTETPIPFIDKLSKDFVNQFILGLPNLVGRVGAQGIAGTEAALEGGVSVLTGGKFDFERRAQRNISDDILGTLNTLPKPTTQQATALSGAIAKEFPKTVRPIDQLDPQGRPIADPVAPLSERIGPAFADELARVNAEEQRIAEKFPFKTGAAEVGADILALTLGKMPFTKSIKAAEAGFATKKFADSMTNPGTRKVVEAVRDSSAFAALKRGTFRTAETSAEALMLSVFNEGDPLQTAAYAAAGQAAGSLVLGGLKGTGNIVKGHPLLSAVITTGVLIQMLDQIKPGEEASFIKSLDSGFDKVYLGMIAGATVTLAGAGRLRQGTLADNWPKITEAISSIPRARSIAVLEDYMNATQDEQQTIDATLKQLQIDPNFFGPEISDRLEKAFESGNLTQALRE